MIFLRVYFFLKDIPQGLFLLKRKIWGFFLLLLLSFKTQLGWIILTSRPIVFSFCHRMSIGHTFVPLLAGISSTRFVKLSVITKNTCFLHVLLIIICLLFVIRFADSIIFRPCHTRWYVGGFA